MDEKGLKFPRLEREFLHEIVDWGKKYIGQFLQRALETVMNMLFEMNLAIWQHVDPTSGQTPQQYGHSSVFQSIIF